LRAEAFNALHHPNFDHPVNASVGSPSILSTVIRTKLPARRVAPPSTQTIIQTGESGRIIQFAETNVLMILFLAWQVTVRQPFQA
jgi:hypothetical protein